MYPTTFSVGLLVKVTHHVIQQQRAIDSLADAGIDPFSVYGNVFRVLDPVNGGTLPGNGTVAPLALCLITL